MGILGDYGLEMSLDSDDALCVMQQAEEFLEAARRYLDLL
jgi:hypothetical protein